MMSFSERYKPAVSTARTRRSLHEFMPGPILTLSGLIAAVAYVRVSTEHQESSTDAQSEALLCYAEAHGIEITRTYSER